MYVAEAADVSTVWEIAVVGGAYLLGGVLTGYYLVRIRTGEDVRHLGSGSAGARNVGRRLGVPGFVLTLLGDALKGALALTLALWAGAGPGVASLALLAVVAGHLWPLQLGFRGGKGLATALGGLLVLDGVLTFLSLLAAALLLALTRHATVSGLLVTALLPTAAALLGRPLAEVMGLAGLALLVMFAHRRNLMAIMTEIRQKRSDKKVG